MRCPNGTTGLYVGQGFGEKGVTNRITKGHMRSSVRRAEPNTLHYNIWEEANYENDTWVILGQLPNGVDDEMLTLNVFEMWCSLVMRSLQYLSLGKYLAEGVRVCVVEGVRQANVDSPLNQGRSERHNHGVAALKNSTDAASQLVYQNFIATATDRFVGMVQADNQARLARALTGGEQKLTRYNDLQNYCITLHHIEFTVPGDIGRRLYKGRPDKETMMVNVLYDLRPPGQEHPNKVCPYTTSKDDANRMGIRLTGTCLDGTTVQIWVVRPRKGDFFKKVNFLVDFLDGKPEDVTKKDRWFPTTKDPNRKKAFYT
jgi:hypothetical protein